MLWASTHFLEDEVDDTQLEGLGFENVSTARRSEGTVQLLVVSGDVVNTAAIAKLIPPLRGALLTAGDREVQNWTFQATAGKVQPGQRVSVEIEGIGTLDNPFVRR